MSTQPKSPLVINATSLGPVASLSATLSPYSQNLVYARNGTGKSFITRALRYLDLFTQGQDVAGAAADLVSEESTTGQGSFSIVEGPHTLASMSLNSRKSEVNISIGDRIFHVFSDDFVQQELRQRDYNVDGDIETEITLDHVNIDTKEAEVRVEEAKRLFSEARIHLQDHLEKEMLEQLIKKAGISKRLKEFQEVQSGCLLTSHQLQPALPSRLFKDILIDLDVLKSIPSEPDYPQPMKGVVINQGNIAAVNELLVKITSPSTVSEEIKAKISKNGEFFENGVDLLLAEGQKNCPFCDQSIEHSPAKDHIAAYISYFADAEGKHKKDLRVAWTLIKSYQKELEKNAAFDGRQASKFESLKHYIPSQKTEFLPNVSVSVEALNAILGEYLTAIGEKGKSPSSPGAIPVLDLSQIADSLKTAVEAANAQFSNLNKAVLSSDAERKNLQREACNSFAIEFLHSNWSKIQELNELSKQIREAETALIELKKSQLSAKVKERVANSFEQLILHFFGTRYTFDKNGFVLKREDKRMARGPSRTLSDGEKTAIAFCYFIACAHKKVRTQSDYSKLYFVFDDPITSMSYDFVFAIAQTLKNLSISKSGDISINPAHINHDCSRPDLLVFTHSSYFYNVCVTNAVIKDKSAFFLYKASIEHKISKLSKYVAPFEQHLKEIYDVNEGKDPDHTTGNSIRCVLEAVGRFCHPDKCESLSTYIKFLAGDEGLEIRSVLINNLSHGTYYHETPSPDEIRDACAEALKIVERYARGQLEIVKSLYAEITAKQPAIAVA